MQRMMSRCEMFHISITKSLVLGVLKSESMYVLRVCNFKRKELARIPRHVPVYVEIYIE